LRARHRPAIHTDTTCGRLLGVASRPHIRLVQHTDRDAVGEEPHPAAAVGVVAVGAQRVQFGRVDLLDLGAAAVVDREDRPDSVARGTGGLRLWRGTGAAA